MSDEKLNISGNGAIPPPTLELLPPSFADEEPGPVVVEPRCLSAEELLEETVALAQSLESDLYVFPNVPPRVLTPDNHLIPLRVAEEVILEPEIFRYCLVLCQEDAERAEFLESLQTYRQEREAECRQPAFLRRRLKPPVPLNGFDVDYEVRTGEERARFRCTIFFCETADEVDLGLSVLVRRILPEPWSPRLIGINEPCKKLLDEFVHGKIGGGLILIGGGTGNGKSTLLTTMIELVNQNRSAHILTFECPIEYKFTSQKSVVTQIRVPQHVPGYPEAARMVPRLHAQILVVHEIRDAESAWFALLFAKKGLTVVATIHGESTFDCVEQLAKYIGQDEETYQSIAHNTTAIVFQKLVDPSPLLLDRYVQVDPEFQRRCLVQEVVRPNENRALQEVLCNPASRKEEAWFQAIGKGQSALLEAALAQREISFEEALAERLREKVQAVEDIDGEHVVHFYSRISEAEAEQKAVRKAYMRQLIRAVRSENSRETAGPEG